MKDVIIIGGGPAGLSAALILGRCLRNVAIVQSGKPRNSQAKSAHNLLGREGINPLELLERGRNEINRFPNVELIDKNATSIQPVQEGYKVTIENDVEIIGKKLLLATGVIDKLPSIPGLEMFWGKNAFACPYCHGYEFKDEPIAIYCKKQDQAYDFALLLQTWSKDIVLFSDGEKVLSPPELQHLKELGISVHEEPITRFTGKLDEDVVIELESGLTLKKKAIFLRGEIEQRSRFAQELGCNINQHGFVVVDSFQKTSTPGVYAAGDMTTMFATVANAIAQGCAAGAMVNHELVSMLKCDSAKSSLTLQIPQPQAQLSTVAHTSGSSSLQGSDDDRKVITNAESLDVSNAAKLKP